MTDSGKTNLLERALELDSIHQVLESARSGSGRCLVISAEAGIGKSALLEAACDQAASHGMAVLLGRGSELERDFTFGVALQLFEPLVSDQSKRDELISGSAGLAEPLFTRAEVPDGGAAGEFGLLHGLHWLAANASERGPLLIAVDDAHWADAPSLRWLHYLLQRLDELPIAVVLTSRLQVDQPQEGLIRRVSSNPRTVTVHPGPLSPAAVADLVRSAVELADDELCAACSTATGGNPFYVRDFLAAMHSGGDPAELEGATARPFSATVHARLESLGDPAVDLAGAVAVLGDGASLARAGALAGLDPDRAAAAADDLARASIIDSDLPLTFIHPLVREAVYAGLPPAGRARSHARAAELLRAEDAGAEKVASHIVEAGVAADASALTTLREAASSARGRGAPSAAARYLRAAAALSEGRPEHGPLLAELALAEALAREGRPAERAQEALRAIEDPRERGEAALRIGMALVDSSDPAAADVLASGLDGLGGAAEHDQLAMRLRASRVAVGIIHAIEGPGDLDSIVERANRGEVIAAERLVLAHGALARGLRGEEIDEVGRLARAGLSGATPDVTSPMEISAHSLAATALFLTGAFSEAERELSVSIDRARERGAVLAFGSLSHVRAHALHRRGQLGEAIADFQSALDTVRYGWEPELPALYAVLALCLVERGDLEAAEGALDVPGGVKRWGSSFTWADVIDTRGRVRLARGDAEGALEDFLACGERLKPLGTSHSGVVPWRQGAVEAALALGRSELAGELAHEDLELARAFGAKRELGDALRGSGLVAGGSRGIELLREAVETLRNSEAELELARSLTDLGDALFEEGHRLQAREALTEALDLAHRCRATPMEERARERLVASGARPRRASTRGSDALTPRERRISAMAAEGMSNRAIAEALFITTKTVETHLGRAYRKLEITSRTDLPAALAER